jgi:hypothetical protein
LVDLAAVGDIIVVTVRVEWVGVIVELLGVGDSVMVEVAGRRIGGRLIGEA